MSGVDCDVIVVGAGPSGLLLAGELSRRGVSVALLERRANLAPGTRAIGVHPPTLAALEGSGATEQILAGAVKIPRGVARSRGRQLGEVRFDRLHTRFPFVAASPQAVTEAALCAGAPEPVRGVRVLSLCRDGGGVVVETEGAAGGGEMRCRAVVVAAGASGRELVAADLGVRAREYPDRYLMTDIDAAPTQPEATAVVTLDAGGVLESFPLPGGGRRLVAWVGRDGGRDGGRNAGRNAGRDAAPSELASKSAIERLRQAVAARTGDEALAAAVGSAQAFEIRRVLLQRMRRGRIFAIGDAAHEVSPIGGQGMNLGLLDAATLAPLLAAWLQSPDEAAGLDRWERDRLASARTAARLASLNTSMGRARPRLAHAATAAMLGATLRSPLARVAARAYAMGFDRDAAATPPGHR